MPVELPDDLVRRESAEVPEPLTLELVFDTPLSAEEVVGRVAAALPGTGAVSSAVFDPAGDRFHFVDLPGVDPKGQEILAFALSRALRPEVGAAEVNPVLPDSLYGAEAVGVDTESLAGVCSTPRQNLSPFGWHHPRIATPAAWARTRGAGAVVASIDTGYSSHQELRGAIRTAGQANFVEGGTDARDRFSAGPLKHPGHGTLVASVVASRGTANASGVTGHPGAITGTAPEAQVLPIRAIRSVVDFTQRTIGPAISHATASGADVICMALGGPTRVASTEAGLRQAVGNGLVVVCAAGNCYPSVVFPASYAPFGLCTAVAALQPDLRPWEKTGRGPEVSFSAFGEHVWGAAKNKASDPDHGIRSSQGTTLATSMTAGVAALWVARHGGRQALLARARAAGTTVQAMWHHCAASGMTRPPEWAGSTSLGAGVLNAKRALDAPLPDGTEALLTARGDVESTTNILQAFLANNHPEAAAELDASLADFAAEILWRGHRAGARARVAETEAAVLPPAEPLPPDLDSALAGKPALRAVVGAG